MVRKKIVGAYAHAYEWGEKATEETKKYRWFEDSKSVATFFSTAEGYLQKSGGKHNWSHWDKLSHSHSSISFCETDEKWLKYPFTWKRDSPTSSKLIFALL